MNWIVERTLSFFVDNFPPLKTILVGGPISIAWSYACLFFAGYLKRKKGLKTGYTRKIFHFLIFGSVAAIQWLFGTPIVCLFGGMTTLVIFYAIYRGSGNPLYEAMAREKDEPHGTHYIVVPYFATLIGGLASNILFGPLAIVGYLVTGLGDAIGEPIGTRYGRHIYRVPSLTSVKAIRSWEGSLAVLIMSLMAVIVSVVLSPDMVFTYSCLLTIPLLAVLSALVESVSPHGWDNTTMQVIPTMFAKMLI